MEHSRISINTRIQISPNNSKKWNNGIIRRTVKHRFVDFKDPPQNEPCDAPVLLCFAPFSGPKLIGVDVGL